MASDGQQLGFRVDRERSLRSPLFLHEFRYPALGGIVVSVSLSRSGGVIPHPTREVAKLSVDLSVAQKPLALIPATRDHRRSHQKHLGDVIKKRWVGTWGE